MTYTLTSNPALAARYFIEDRANSVAREALAQQGGSLQFRVELASGAPGLVIRVWPSGQDPIVNRIGWVRERRITRRRRVRKDEE